MKIWLGAALLLLIAPSAWAQGLCSYNNPTACGSPGINNANIGGTLSVGGAEPLNGGGSMTGTFTGDPTLPGNPNFSGSPVFSGTPTFTGTPFFTGYTVTDVSGTLTTGGAAQTIMGADANRKGCSIQNLSPLDLWVSNVGTASNNQPSEWVPAGSEWSCPFNMSTAAISVYGAATGQPFTARSWK